MTLHFAWHSSLALCALASLSPQSPGQSFVVGGKAHLPSESTETLAFCFGDIDGDGIQDYAALDLRPWVSINQGIGNLRFRRTATLPAPAPGVSSVGLALADFDGDLDLDLMAGSSLHVNDGTGAFSAATSIALPNPWQFYGPEAFDADGDGDLDLLYTSTSQDAQLFLNNGAAQFVSRTLSSVRGWGLAVGDIDGDGDLDVMTGGTLLINDGSAGFTTTPLPSSVVSAATATADIDGDGTTEFLFARGPTGPHIIGFSGGVVQELGSRGLTALPVPTSQYSIITTGDIDADGDVDVWIAAWPEVGALFLNTGAGQFQQAAPALLRPTQVHASSIGIVDVDGDGLSDLFAGTLRDRDRLFHNTGGGFVDVGGSTNPNRLTWWGGTAVADFDSDGDLDAVLGPGYLNTFAQTLYFENDGRGGFRDVTATHMAVHFRPFGTEYFYRALEVTDVDGDGDLDLVGLADSFPLQAAWVHLLLNDGSGRFTSRASVVSRAASSMLVEDFDNDGDPDIVAPGQLPAYLRNEGGGAFTPTAMVFPGPIGGGSSPAAGDIDGDGDVDIALDGLSSALWVNLGTSFVRASATAFPLDGTRSSGLRLADLDGDGDLDLIADRDNLSAGIYRNDGLGNFVDHTATWLPNPPQGGLEPIDVDGDGDVDLLARPRLRSTGTTELYRNDGTGRLQPEPSGRPAGWTGIEAIADLDGDGDLDIVDRGSRLEVAYGRDRHLRLPLLARPGRPYAIEIHALGSPTAAVWMLALGLASQPIDLGPTGMFHLDPSQILSSPPLAFGRSGTATQQFQFPSAPALIGADFHVQAAIVRGGVILTNALTDTIVP